MRITGVHISVGLLGIVTAAALALQWQSNDELRTEIAMLRVENQKIQPLRLQHDRLAAVQPPPAALEAMRSDHAAVERLRGEVELMRNRVKELEGH